MVENNSLVKMPKRKSPEGAEGKDAPKVTKQEKPAPPKPEAKPKKTIVKKVADDKGVKAKKVVAKGKKDDGPSQNGETKTNEETEATEEATEEKA